jgi:hypothetical protein
MEGISYFYSQTGLIKEAHAWLWSPGSVACLCLSRFFHYCNMPHGTIKPLPAGGLEVIGTPVRGCENVPINGCWVHGRWRSGNEREESSGKPVEGVVDTRNLMWIPQESGIREENFTSPHHLSCSL